MPVVLSITAACQRSFSPVTKVPVTRRSMTKVEKIERAEHESRADPTLSMTTPSMSRKQTRPCLLPLSIRGLDLGFRRNDSRGIPPRRDAPTKRHSGHAYFTACPREDERRGLILKMASSASLVMAHLSEFAAKRLRSHHVGHLANLLRSQ